MPEHQLRFMIETCPPTSGVNWMIAAAPGRVSCCGASIFASAQATTIPRPGPADRSRLLLGSTRCLHHHHDVIHPVFVPGTPPAHLPTIDLVTPGPSFANGVGNLVGIGIGCDL